MVHLYPDAVPDGVEISVWELDVAPEMECK